MKENKISNTKEFKDVRNDLSKDFNDLIHRSPIKYSVFYSKVNRFSSNKNKDTSSVYNVDNSGSKVTIENHCKNNRQFYAVAFHSKTPRFKYSKKSDSDSAADVFYHPKKLKNAKDGEIEEFIKNTPNHFSIHRSNYPRFHKMRISTAPGIYYDPDCGSKITLSTNVRKTPNPYCYFKSKSPKMFQRPKTSKSYENILGPGSYDYDYIRDIRNKMKNRPNSSFISKSDRFHEKENNLNRNLGTRWKLETDLLHWTKRPHTISTTKYTRPSYL